MTVSLCRKQKLWSTQHAKTKFVVLSIRLNLNPSRHRPFKSPNAYFTVLVELWTKLWHLCVRV